MMNNYKRTGNFFLMLLFLFGVLACGDEEREEHSEEEGVVQEMGSGEDELQAWNYENTDWRGDNDCETAVQSPVNIDTTQVIEANLSDIQYEYEPFNMRIVDNGHTIQVSGTEDSYVTVEGKRYQFRQFHFHNPSEHTINGRRYPLEMHLVHQEMGSSNLVVLGIFIEEGDTENRFLEKVFSEIPSTPQEEVQTNIELNLSDYIPPAQKHYTYIGSLTTPPCTVGVDWILFQEPIQASGDQIDRFADLYADSARPVQPLNNRRVLESSRE